jgi:threonine-phosphate decarboxylase
MLGKNSTFFTTSPTFGEYELSARLTGATWASGMHNADVFFFCNPNNPTGILQKKASMKNTLKKMASHGGFLFCDEVFIGLADPKQSLSDISNPHLFVLHSLTKSFSVPGIRFGFGFGNADLIEKMETVRPPWSVNAFAEAYAMEALLHLNELSASRTAIEQERNWLVNKINAIGLECHPSSVNYLLIECGHDVTALCDALSRRHILVRNCSSFGLSTSIRVAVRTHSENQELMEALAACVH